VAAAAVALVVRLGYAALGIPEYWGDAYHNWLMSQLTLEHGGVLSDYKGREVVWEPLYRYLSVGVTVIVGGETMLAGRLVSLLSSVTTCGLITLLVTRLTDVRWGLAAGLTLALAPWHVAYGWMYMPEATASLLFVSAVLLVVRGGGPWLVPVAALGALVRHDVTVLLILTSVWLMMQRRRRDAAWLAVGVVAGLLLWSAWTWYAAGRPLAWLEQRVAGSTADAAFNTELGVRPTPRPWTVLLMLAQLYAPLVVLVGAVAVGWRHAVWRTAMHKGSLMWFLLAAFTLILTIMQVKFFSYPDPRYVVITLPLAVVCSALALRGLPDAWRGRLGIAHALVVAVALATQIPTFAFRAWTLSQDRAVGTFLRTNAPAEGRLLVDAPVSIHYSGVPPERFVAWSQLMAGAPPDMPAPDAMLQALQREHVALVYAFRASFTDVPRLIPGLAGDTAFVAKGLRFEPMYRYVAWTPPADHRPWWAPIRVRVERGRDGGTVWRVVPEDTNS